jgi:DNA-binding NarL/FixJ family response regulator
MAETFKIISVLEDDSDLRGYLITIINQCEGIKLGFATGSLAETIKQSKVTKTDLFLVDINLEDGSGIDFLKHLRESDNPARALVLTVLGDRETVMTALRVGANGYLLKDTSEEQICQAIKATLDGESPISPQAARFLLQMVRTDPNAEKNEGDNAVVLTMRETEVLQMFSRGLSYGEVAKALGISRHTIGDHVKGIYRKLQVHSRSEAIYEAQQMGLLRS